MVKKIFSVSIPTFLLLVTIAVAGTFLISGTVFGNIEFLKTVNFGDSKIGQDTTKTIGKAKSLITEPFNLSVSCNDPSIILPQLNMPIGSTISSYVLNLQGNNVISPNITVGDLSLAVRSQKMGFWNCSFSVQNSTFLNVSFIDTFG